MRRNALRLLTPYRICTIADVSENANPDALCAPIQNLH
jgi:hypothetical protein